MKRRVGDHQADNNVFANLGRDLASTTDAHSAARTILDAANTLIGWDAAYLILYDPTIGGIPRPLLTIDTISMANTSSRQMPCPISLVTIC